MTEEEQRLEKMKRMMHDLIGVLCDAITASVTDLDTISKIGNQVQAGLARLQEIDRAVDAERDPGMQLN